MLFVSSLNFVDKSLLQFIKKYGIMIMDKIYDSNLTL